MIQSKTQIDKLGEELKNDTILLPGYLLLDEYRLSFASAYQYVFDTIVQETGLLPTGRPAKTFFSIRAKLQRENTRLSQMQDIAGCRLICNGIKEQEHIITQLTDLFPDSKIIDRRQKTSHGYRAVHLIPKISGKLIEIQLRTENQQLWAETSEKLADLIDPLIKYGGGESEIQRLLHQLSDIIRRVENQEMKRISIKEETAITAINESDFVLEEDLKVYLRKNLDLISQLNEGSEDRRKAG